MRPIAVRSRLDPFAQHRSVVRGHMVTARAPAPGGQPRSRGRHQRCGRFAPAALRGRTQSP
eukprot:3931486-Alexandrium_andersonii.AAC.1